MENYKKLNKSKEIIVNIFYYLLHPMTITFLVVLISLICALFLGLVEKNAEFLEKFQFVVTHWCSLLIILISAAFLFIANKGWQGSGILDPNREYFDLITPWYAKNRYQQNSDVSTTSFAFLFLFIIIGIIIFVLEFWEWGQWFGFVKVLSLIVEIIAAFYLSLELR